VIRWRVTLVVWVLVIALPSAAQHPTPGDTPLGDVLTVIVSDRDLLAIDAESGGQTTERLRLAEQVLWQGARGKVGVVITDQRVLAVATQSGAWQETDYRRDEAPPQSALLGERVALLITSERVLGFNGGSGNLVEYRLGLREQFLDARVGANVGVVITDRNALGLSPFAGGFFEVALDLAEQIDRITADSNVATLRGSRRLWIFRATTGSWEQRSRSLR
jgi:hypothetical protein